MTFETFDAAPFSAAVKALLTAKGFTAPSKIQQHAWPVACAGRDAIAVAKTGSGKTLAFLLPILHTLGWLSFPSFEVDLGISFARSIHHCLALGSKLKRNL